MNNMSFEYKVSVIVPVYNVEQYLRGCLDSLLAQTIDHELMEVLLINDGSTDNSLAICQEYAELFSLFKILSQENSGVSAARNYGIREAKGKYIMFLDSDDMLGETTIQAVTDYFDKVYDEVDLVTYPERKFENGKQLPVHFRYKFLTKTGIYDLNKCIYSTISRVNIAFKNTSHFFDVSLHFAEDQQFLYEIIKDKMKIGYINGGMYKYMIRSDSAIGSSGYAFYFWESVVSNYYEKLFNKYEDNIPQYLQAMFLYDSNWKIRKDQFFPYHYEGEEFQKAVQRLRKILKRIDIEIILKHPSLDYYHKFFLLKLRETPIAIYTDNLSVSMLAENKVIHTDKSFTIVITQFKIYNNELKILGHLKSPLFSFCEKPILTANVNGETEEIPLFESTASRYKSKMKTNTFWAFYYCIALKNDLNVKFNVNIDGFEYNTIFYFMPLTSIDTKNGITNLITEKGILNVENNTISYSEASESDSQKAEIYKEYNKLIIKLNPTVYNYRLMKKTNQQQKIWLYYDCKGVKKDNGYYQFMHDSKMNDGIERYFVLNNEESRDLFDDPSKVIEFGSNKHKSLFLNADKIITAFIEKNNVYPFSNNEIPLISDLLQFETIYLQHGILHASIPWKYTPESLQIDKVVVSSYFEAENFVKKYNFREEDIIKCGMPRFNYIDRTAQPKNRVLFAPSWRNYLIKPQVDNYWEPEYEKFMKSDYFMNFNSFLNSPILEEVLNENNLYLDFKIHPIFTTYMHLFENKNEHVNFAGDSVKDEEYAAFITDFSSFVFDFAYLKRPIIYFVPDYPQFKSGMNQYRELDLPFEKAFGSLVTDNQSAVDELIRIIKNNFVPDPIFKERMDKFFLPMEKSSETLYNYLMGM